MCEYYWQASDLVKFLIIYIVTDSLGYAKLPLYNDVIRIPPTSSPPPPYSSRKKPVHAIACLEPTENG